MTHLHGPPATPRQAIFYGLLCAVVGGIIAGVGYGLKAVVFVAGVKPGPEARWRAWRSYMARPAPTRASAGVRKRESRPIELDTRFRGYDGTPQDSTMFWAARSLREESAMPKSQMLRRCAAQHDIFFATANYAYAVGGFDKAQGLW